MTPSTEQPTPSEAREQALAWLARLSSGDVTAEERAAFRRWQAEAELHRAEFEKLAAMWGTFDHIADPRVASRRHFLAGSAVACVAALGVGAAYRTHLWTQLTGGYVTDPGEMRSVRLVDGTTLDMDADTALSVDISPAKRTIEVHRGRVMLSVTPDSNRPLLMSVRNGRAISDGSQFVVHLAEDETILTVLDQTVRLSLRSTSSTEGGITVKASESVVFDTRGLRPVQQADAAETAWKKHRLIFDNKSLRSVVSELNRYRSGRIVLLDEDLGRLRLSGLFDTRDPDRVLASIESTLPVRLTRLPYLVLMRAA